MADSTHNPLPEPNARWLLLPGFAVALAGIITALFARARIIARPISPTPAPDVPAPTASATTQHTVHSTQHVSETAASPRRTLAFITLAVVIAIALIVLQNNASPLAIPLFVVVMIGALILAAVRSAAKPKSQSAFTQSSVLSPHHAPSISLLRILAFLALSVGVAIGLIALQSDASPLAAWVFIAVMVGALILAVASAPVRVRRVILSPARMMNIVHGYIHPYWKSLVAILVFYRFRIAALSVFGALGLMILSSQAFQISRVDHTPIDDAVKYMLAGGVALGVAVFFARPNIALPTLPAVRIRVLAHVNKWTTGVGIAVLLFLSETNGKATGTARIYVIDTETQFWLLVLGISLVVMGLSGWQPLLRLRPFKWRPLLLGMLLVIASEVMTSIVSFGVFKPWANDLINAVIFVVIRLGDVLILWTFIPPQVKLLRPTLEFNRRNFILFATAVIVIYILASLSGTILLDVAFALAVTPAFWVFMVFVNFARVPVAALYQRYYTNTEQVSTHYPALSTQHFSSSLAHYAALIGIVLIAIFTRFYLLNDTMRFMIDEDSFIGATNYLRVVPTMEILAPHSSVAAFPYMYAFFQRHSMDVFGMTLGGFRATSAIFGVLGVVALYFLARTLFDRRTALLAALFLAVLPVHIQFSRIGICEIASPFFGTLAFAFIGRGLLHGRRTDYAIGGAMLGLTHYFHEGGRLLYTPLTIAWVAACLLVALRQKNAPPLYQLGRVTLRSWGGDRWRNLLVALAALVIVAAPIYYTLIGMNRPLFARMVNNNSGLGGTYWSTLGDPVNLNNHYNNHFLPAFRVYVNQVDNTLFYADENAFTLPALVPLFLFGVFYALWRWRSPGMLLLLGWLLSTSLGNSLMVDSAGSPRYVMVFPALALACAVGLRYTVPLLIRHASRARALIALAAVAFALLQVNYFFNDHLPAYNTAFRAAKGNPDGYDAALRSMDFPVATNVHIISQNVFPQIEAMGLVRLKRDDIFVDTLAPDDVTDEYIGDLTCRVDHAFFIERSDFRSLDKLRTYFYLREAQLTPYDDFPPSQRLILFYAPYMKGTEKFYDRKC